MKKSVPFWKYQATGNDFILVEEASVAGLDLSRFSQQACNRHFGIGSDGLIVLGDSAHADTRMYFFNPDGTPDVCGNGIRCVGLHMLQTRELQQLRVQTNAGIVSVQVEGERFSVTGTVSEAPMPHQCVVDGREISGFLLNTGTPHFVIFCDALSDELVLGLGPKLEHHQSFSEAVSIDFVQQQSPQKISIRIWERSVGETLSCGTGASAAALCAHQMKGADDALCVACPGGDLEVTLPAKDIFVLSGGAQCVFTGVYHL